MPIVMVVAVTPGLVFDEAALAAAAVDRDTAVSAANAPVRQATIRNLIASRMVV
jgi:hypothetical protein